jgi:hypothetical protein
MLSKRKLPFFLKVAFNPHLMFKNHELYCEEVVGFLGKILGENEVNFLEFFVLDVFEYVNEILHLSLLALPWFNFKETS